MQVNQLKVGAILSYFHIITNSVIGIAYVPIMLRFLGQSEFGLYSLCSSIVGYLGLFNMGFSSAYIRYYSIFRAEDNETQINRLNGMFLLVFIFIALLVVISGIVVVFNIEEIMGNKFTENELQLARILMSIMTFNVALTMPSSVFSSFIASREKFIFQKSIEILRIVCNPILTLPLLVMGYRSIAVVLVVAFLTIATFLANLWFCMKVLNVKFEFRNMEFPLLKDVFVFSFFIFLQIIMDKMNWEVNKFIIGRYCGSVAVAIYTVGLQLNMFFIQFSTAISSVFVPRINKIVAEKQGDLAISLLFVKVARLQFIIVFLIFTLFVFFGEKFILFWAGAGYENSYPVALLLMIPIVLPLTENLGIEILRAKNLHGFINSIYVVISIISVTIAIPLVKIYNEFGGAIATCITMFVGHMIVTNIYFHFWAKIDIRLYLKEILKFLPASILSCIFGSIIIYKMPINTISTFICSVSIYILIYCGAYWFLGLNTYEKNLVCSFINKFR